VSVVPDKSSRATSPGDSATLPDLPASRSRLKADGEPTQPGPGSLTGVTPLSADHNKAALEAMLLSDELRRAHGFSAVIGLISLGVLAALPLFPGDPDVKRVYIIALAIWVPMSFWVWRATAPGYEYRLWKLRLYAITIALGVTVAECYVGVFSPVVAVLTLGIYYVGQSADPVQSLAISGYVIASYVGLAVLMTLDIVPDRGLFSAEGAALSSHVFGVLAGAGVLLLTLYLARMSRASMRATIASSIEAMLVARRREALLLEAHEHLERALEVAIGKPGHCTGKLAGPYRLDVVIGAGAMGEIYAAQNTETGQKAAVKLLQTEAQQRPILVERFLREGAICQKLKSPHLVDVYAVGRLEDGAPYMAMELLAGGDLASILRKDGRLPIDIVSELALALAEGLNHAHAAGVIHRDLKPLNVFQCRDAAGRSTWKILDFGISKFQTSNETLTQLGIVGTPGYMSPEQARGQSVDYRSDIFSMAVVLYRALTGRPAFTGSDMPQILFEVVYKTPERPSSIVKQLPHDVDLVLAVALAKNPEERWQSAREFAQAFELAARQNLDAPRRARAHALVRAFPWGQAALGIGDPASEASRARN
jgi:eukaryotic-like serine/threonine-protein kinase